MIEAALPQAPPMQRHRNNQPLTVQRAEPSSNQPCKHWSKRDLAPVFETQHQITRGIIIHRACRNSVMLRRFGKALVARIPALFGIFKKGQLAPGATWLGRNNELAPTWGA